MLLTMLGYKMVVIIAQFDRPYIVCGSLPFFKPSNLRDIGKLTFHRSHYANPRPAHLKLHIVVTGDQDILAARGCLTGEFLSHLGKQSRCARILVER
jgi:hypothetical protein